MIDKVNRAPKGIELSQERVHRIPQATQPRRPKLHDQPRLGLARQGSREALENSQFAALGIDLQKIEARKGQRVSRPARLPASRTR